MSIFENIKNKLTPNEGYSGWKTGEKFLKGFIIYLLAYIATNNAWSTITIGSLALAGINYIKYNWKNED